MKIFRVSPDVAKFQWLIAEPESVYASGRLMFDCQPKLAGWLAPAVYVHHPKRRAGDFLKFVPGALTCEPRATELLRAQFERAGELLSLPLGNRVLTVLNVLECVNCLDEARSEIVPELISQSTYAFLPSRLTGSSLFMIPQTSRAEILTVQGRGGTDPDDDFKSIVESNRLTGLTFDLLWEGPS